jgi:hypothetical protein
MSVSGVVEAQATKPREAPPVRLICGESATGGAIATTDQRKGSGSQTRPLHIQYITLHWKRFLDAVRPEPFHDLEACGTDDNIAHIL